jgi:hypothetical protein
MTTLAAIPITPETITAGLSILAALWQAWRARRYHDAASTLIDGIETAARYDNNPKHAVRMQAAAAVAKTIDGLLAAKGYLSRSRP